MVDGPYPRISDVSGVAHIEIRVIWEAGGKPQNFCGDNSCPGGCGFPALIMTYPGFSLKASGSQVAIGRVMRNRHKRWAGPEVEVLEAHRKALAEAMWF